jgi:hypothetical protein
LQQQQQQLLLLLVAAGCWWLLLPLLLLLLLLLTYGLPATYQRAEALARLQSSSAALEAQRASVL